MYRRTSNFILETRKIYVYSSFTRKLVTETIRLHGSRPTFSLISPVTRFLASIWKQCPSIKCTPTFPIRARKGSAVARSIVVNTRMIVSVTRNFPLCVIRTRQSSESGGVIFFFYEGTMQRNVRNVLRDVRNYVRHRNVPCLARGCRSSLVPPRPTEKIKIINVSFDAWTFSLTGKRREIN